ncbi:MAG: hypothetical protein ACYC3Q_02750 [Gemmatimonadaceae bacterium]
MNRSEARRTAIPLIIGIISSLVAFSAVGWLRRDRCVDGGGTYDMASRRCLMADGVTMDVAYAGDLMAGLVVGVALALMLHRATTFATRRGSP